MVRLGRAWESNPVHRAALPAFQGEAGRQAWGRLMKQPVDEVSLFRTADGRWGIRLVQNRTPAVPPPHTAPTGRE